eukprot:TRINITY_DN13057_c0_g1_i1.p1 TRINITY_DN13057_c0_g1~~TRINITY_DN13057_c0_g1_i1.p1  ORF type:complete len:1213 (+),score=163.16 TRINITY_DN13057_c0_g1_i1:67-3639(+)
MHDRLRMDSDAATVSKGAPFPPRSSPTKPVAVSPSPPVGTLAAKPARKSMGRRHSCWYFCQALLGTAAVVGASVAALVLMPPETEASLSSFMEADVEVFTIRSGFFAALDDRVQASRRLAVDYLYRRFYLIVAYELEDTSDGQDIVRADIISRIAGFEQELRSIETWQSLCAEIVPGSEKGCDPGLSLANYMYPTRVTNTDDIVPQYLKLNGEGGEMLPLQAGMDIAEAQQAAKHLLPQSGGQEAGGVRKRLRSVFWFNMLCCDSTASAAMQREWLSTTKQRWSSLLTDDVLPMLREADESNSKLPGLRVYFDGTNVITTEVLQTLQSDLHLALGSMGFVLVYLACHTRSILLSISGILTVMLSIPLAYAVFAALSGSQEMSIASYLSVFLMVGLGTDVVFVYSDFWRDSPRYCQTDNERVWYTYKNGLRASLATTVATCLSFFANLASVIRPLREFGFFMGLCVFNVWLLVPLIFMPMCVLDERWCKCRRRREAPKPGGGCLSSRGEAFGRFTRHLRRFRFLYLLVPLLLSVVLVIQAVQQVTTSSSVPQLFPDNHRQTLGDEVLKTFTEVSPDVFDKMTQNAGQDVPICAESAYGLGSAGGCPLHWCHAVRNEDSASNSGCTCYRKDVCGGTTSGQVDMRFFGLETLSDDTVANVVADYIETSQDQLGWFAGTDREDRIRFMRKGSYPRLVMQEWLSGKTVVVPSHEVEIQMRPLKNTSCPFQELCFCGDYGLSCRTPLKTWSHVEQRIVLPDPGRRLQSQWTVPVGRRVVVDVAFGLLVKKGHPILGKRDPKEAWSFNEDFEPANPWIQRDMYAFCTQLPEELRITRKACWIESFRDHVEASSSGIARFPVHEVHFHPLVMGFSNSFMEVSPAVRQAVVDFMWLRDGKLKASYFAFHCDVDIAADTGVAQRFRERWDNYLLNYNGQSSPSGWAGGNGEFHTSELWVRADVQKELIGSMVLTLLIIVVLAFVGVITFTSSFRLSFMTVLATVAVLGELLFVIVVLMGLAIGPLEVIALIFFIGYSVTYSLHIAHHYGSRRYQVEHYDDTLSEPAAIRLQRTMFAMKAIAGAAAGSAVTTCGCAFFLLFCTLTIFRRLGTVAVAVTLLSVVMALFTLPAGLMIFGPLHPEMPFMRRWKGHFPSEPHVSLPSPLPALPGDDDDVEAQPAVGLPSQPRVQKQAILMGVTTQ